MSESGVFRERDRLDGRLAEGRLKPRHARALGRALAERHRAGAKPVAEPPGPTRVLQRWQQALRALERRALLTGDEARRLNERFGPEPRRALDRLLARQPHWRPLLDFRAGTVHVRGRAARLDLPDDSRSGDPAEDLAGLAAPLRRAGCSGLAEQLLAAYALASDDYPLYSLIDFFECLLACEAAAQGGRQFLEPWLAPRNPEPAYLILLTGGVASGKSTLAKDLVRDLAAPRVVADRVRLAVLEPVREAAGPLAALDRAWSMGFGEDSYAALLERASAVLASGRHCIVDACTPRAKGRLRASEVARRHGAELVVCSCVASPARRDQRLRARDERDGVAPGSWQQIADRLWASYEPIADGEPGRHIFHRTESPRECGIAAVRAALGPTSIAAAAPRERPPEAVTFDCWNTLLREADWPRAHALRVDAIERAVREAGEPRVRAEIAEAFDRAWRRHMHLWREGIHSGAREVARWCLEFLGLPLPDSVVEQLTEQLQTASHTGDVVALDGARETLERLADAGVTMALICDTGLTPGRVVRHHLERRGLLGLLQAQLFSDEIGVPKPDPRIFRAALGALGSDPERAVHVGDLRRTDIAGARALGMGSIRLLQAHDDPTRLPEADAVTRCLGDLPALLGLEG